MTHVNRNASLQTVGITGAMLILLASVVGCGSGGGTTPSNGGTTPSNGGTTPLVCVPLSNNITTDRTLALPCYDVTTDIFVENGATLTIVPGVTLKFAIDTKLQIRSDGTLVAVGTAANPILLTGEQQIRGFWNGVYFSDSLSFNNVMDYVTVEYGGGVDFGGGAQGNVVLLDFSSASSVKASITNCTLRESSSYGFYFDTNVEINNFGNNTVTANTLGAGYLFASVIGILDASGSYTGNDTDVVIVDGNTVSTAQTMAAINADYLIMDRFILDAALTIDAGARLVFQLGARLQINDDGTLIAVGTAANPILFTGEQQIRGFWNGVYFSDSLSFNNVMDYVTVEYGGGVDFGSGGQGNVVLLDFSSATPVRLDITNCTLRESSSYGFYFDTNVEINNFGNNTVTANTLGAGYLFASVIGILDASGSYTGNDVDVVIVDGNTVSTAQTMAAIDADYLIIDRFILDAALTIDAGARLVFQLDARLQINDDGTLIAVGTAANPIILTGEQQIPGFWNGVYFSDSLSVNNVMDYVTVEYGGGVDFGSGGQGNVVLLDFSSATLVRVTITNSTIRNSGAWGIWLDNNTALTSSANTFSNNTSGDTFQNP